MWLLCLGCATPVFGQSGSALSDPDRPDVTNGTNIVAPGLVQIEVGGLYSHDTPDQGTMDSPFTVRIGVTSWFEARVGADGLLTQSAGDSRTTGFGNVQLGAKLRLWSDPGGAPVVSVLPTISLPTGTADNGLGSGDIDLTVAMLTGTDIGTRGHVDVNYGIGAIGAGQGLPHFSQHLLSASLSAAVTDRWNPYVEVFWFSRTAPDGAAETSFDTGVIYELGSRFALDGGIQAGIGGPAANFAVFGGLSVVFGADRGINGRQRKVSAPKGKSRAAPPSSRAPAARAASAASPTPVRR
jgi:outer membrane putative beta-barrel porin/alpha-amylase